MSDSSNIKDNRPKTRAVPDNVEDLRVIYSAPDKDGNVRILSDRRPPKPKITVTVKKK